MDPEVREFYRAHRQMDAEGTLPRVIYLSRNLHDKVAAYCDGRFGPWPSAEMTFRGHRLKIHD